MRELHLDAHLYEAKVNIKVKKELSGKWYVETDFCDKTGITLFGERGMFSTFKEAITKHFKRWLDIDIIVNDVGLIIERLVKQFEKEKRNIIETNIEPPKRTMPISDFSDISDWLPENRKKKYLKVVPPASYPLQINISKGTIVGKVTKKADVWYVHGRYKLICSGKDLTSMLIDTLRVVDIFDIIEVKIKSQEIMDWFNLQKQQTLP